MQNNLQTWIYVKSAWEEWLKELPDAEVGEIFKALYTGKNPESVIARGIYLAIRDEFNKVNNSARKKIIQKNERLNN